MKKLLIMLLTACLICSAISFALADEPLKIQMTVRLFDQVPDMSNEYWTRFQEMTNTELDIEWIPDGDYKTKLNLILSSTELPEVLISSNSRLMENTALANAVKNGAFYDLTDLLGDFSEYPNLRDNVAPDAWTFGRMFGKIYGIPQNRPAIAAAPLFRADLFEAAGVEIPHTMDELITSLRAVLDQNPGMVGLVSKADLFTNGDGGLANAFGAAEPYFNEEGGLVYTRLTPAYTEFVDWMRRAYEAGILSQEFAVMAPTQATELFASGNAVALVNESIRWCFPFTEKLKVIDENANVSVLPPMKGIDDNYSITRGTGIQDFMLLSAKLPEEKVVAILKYLDATTTAEYYDITTYGFEGVHYTVDADGNKIATEQRDKDMGSSAPWQVIPLMYNAYQKVDATAATREYNMALRDLVTEMGYFDLGKISPFEAAVSEKWISLWPRYVNDWSATAVRAVVGQISMDDYRAYVDNLNNNAQIKEAYLEFAESYHAIFGE